MGIDRIGKGGGAKPPSTTETGSSSRAGETGRAFEVRSERAGAARGAEAIAPTGASPLERLRAGEIDVNGYVELKLDEATAHLHKLPAAELDAIRGMLRDVVATDPALADLVKQATGHAPSIPEGE